VFLAGTSGEGRQLGGQVFGHLGRHDVADGVVAVGEPQEQHHDRDERLGVFPFGDERGQDLFLDLLVGPVAERVTVTGGPPGGRPPEACSMSEPRQVRVRLPHLRFTLAPRSRPRAGPLYRERRSRLLRRNTAVESHTDDMPATVAPDGSPVDVYLALPSSPEYDPVVDALPPTGSVLDLGCGTGRLSNVLAQRGYDVIAVDESEAMLAHLDVRVQAVQRRIEGLDLGRKFDAVVLASNLINTPDTNQRASLLSTVRRHLNQVGQAYLERYDPQWAAGLAETEAMAGSVRVHFELLDRDGHVFDARVTYQLGERKWTQRFQARIVDDDEFQRAVDDAGLHLDRWLTERWAAVSSA
jgi:SAM-dependent methyltransferase